MKSRHSRQRAAIVEAIRSTTEHPAAEDVYERTKKVIPRLSLGTVYRNLKQLTQQGEIQELDLGAPVSRYDGNPEKHSHFLCQPCGRVLDVDGPGLQDAELELARERGLRVLGHRLVFYGLCPACGTEPD